MNIINLLGNKGIIEDRDGKKWYVEEVPVSKNPVDNCLFDSALQEKFGDKQNLIDIINQIIENRYHSYKKFKFEEIWDMHKMLANRIKRVKIIKKYNISYEMLKVLLGEIDMRKNRIVPIFSNDSEIPIIKSWDDIKREHNATASSIDEMIF